LSTVAFPVEEIVKHVIAQVHTRIVEQDFTSIRKISVESRIVERASCAGAAQGGKMAEAS
jgi:hypothetical protein